MLSLSVAILFVLSSTESFIIHPQPCITKHGSRNPAMHMGFSTDNRRTFLEKGLISAATVLLTLPGKSFALFEGGVEAGLNEIAALTFRTDKLVDDLKSKTLKGGEEDSIVVYRTARAFLDPLQAKMLEVAPTLGLAAEAQKRVELLPLLMKGHLLELDAACRSKDAKEQLQEALEVQETLEEFLTLAGVKYTITRPEPRRSATPLEYYSIFGCEAYGQKRRENSNQCVSDT